ncbi:tyrosine phosphatase [Mycobacterium phage Azrael100]|uniref:Tyrosine phosphatase n=1 Tax=Mycobacterium phage Cosmo TaxID=1567467 RepID=A0A0B5A518_9CAUD|nr:tyrosine phosphatase [Mycobacterium phage Cosmo]WKR36104.1 tyrosine phosphatase [Mycobacterium phage Azrael100]
MSDPTAITMNSNGNRIIGVTAHGGIGFDAPLVSQIKGNLYQGGNDFRVQLDPRFQHMISLYPWGRYPLAHPLETEVYITMYDSTDEAAPQLDILANLVNVCRADGPTLVHCQAGLNRSSLVVARALFLGGDFNDGNEIVDFIRQQRSPACLCNPLFEEKVRSWQR